MECYICHRLVQRHEYTRHVGSHLAGNHVGTHPQPSPVLPTFSYDTMDYDHLVVHPAQSTPPRLQPRIPLEFDRPPRPITSDDRLQSDELEDILADLAPDIRRKVHYMSSDSPSPTTARRETPRGQLNSFQLWLRNPTHDSPMYTTIDGQKSRPDSQEHEILQEAGILRASTKEEVVKIVGAFGGLSSNDKETCLELVRKTPIFPGLVAYTFTHLAACPRRGWLFSGWLSDDWSSKVSELERLVERWTNYSDTECILSYDTIKKELLDILRATMIRCEDHKCNPALVEGTMVSKYDILNLAGLAAVCITGSQRRDILDERSAEVEKLVELFHGLLEADITLGEPYRRYFFNALVMFTKDFGCCPHGIYLEEGAISGLVSESQGGFSFVYKGRLNSRLVAVKALKRSDCTSLPEYNKQLSKEAVVWRHLRHPNCLPLYGIYTMSTDGPNINAALVSPWMDQGTLLKYLERNPKADRTKLVLDMTRGLKYLHSMQPHVAHRDIKPDNILITKGGRACLADFGLASTFDTDDHFHTATSQIVMGGTWNYMAPEIFGAENKEAKRRVNKRACDMYALGCTIYATYTGRHPFSGILSARVRANVMVGERPEFPEGQISPDMWSFVEDLWGQDPLRRLTAEMAVGWMEFKAQQDGVDMSLASLGEEWEWKRPHDGNNSLWSVSPKAKPRTLG